MAAATRTALLQLEMPLAMHAFTGILADMGLCTETLPVVSMMDSNCDAVTQSDNPTPAEVDRVHALLVEISVPNVRRATGIWCLDGRLGHSTSSESV